MPQILDNCVKDLMAKGKSESQAYAICTASLKKAGKMEAVKPEIIENMKFEFMVPFEMVHEDKQDWMNIGGVALTEGTSLNNNVYTFDNLKENDGRNFKWLFGHPEEPEEHVIGMGLLKMAEGKLLHEGKIRNTVKHPDVIQSVKDGFLGPSIHASARKVTREGNLFKIEGLSIDGIGLVAFQGVKDASIDYAIAERFDKLESSKEDALDCDKEEVPIMAEEKIIEKPSMTEDSKLMEELKAVKEELEKTRKMGVVEAILKVNPSLNKEDLLKESAEQLNMRLGYEQKLAETNKPAAVVEKKEEVKSEFVEEKGMITFSKEAYDKFNNEIKSRLR